MTPYLIAALATVGFALGIAAALRFYTRSFPVLLMLSFVCMAASFMIALIYTASPV